MPTVAEMRALDAIARMTPTLDKINANLEMLTDILIAKEMCKEHHIPFSEALDGIRNANEKRNA